MGTKVSVILPVYNVSDYLRQCMDSIVGQTLKDIEIICVDDGSTDDSLAILKEYEAKDQRVKVIQQANAGAGAARNKGLEIATGEYLSFLDSDDFFEPDMLEKAWSKAHETRAQVVVFRSISTERIFRNLFRSDGHFTRRSFHRTDQCIFVISRAIYSRYLWDGLGISSSAGNMLRRTISDSSSSELRMICCSYFQR